MLRGQFHFGKPRNFIQSSMLSTDLLEVWESWRREILIDGAKLELFLTKFGGIFIVRGLEQQANINSSPFTALHNREHVGQRNETIFWTAIAINRLDWRLIELNLCVYCLSACYWSHVGTKGISVSFLSWLRSRRLNSIKVDTKAVEIP